MQIKVVLHGNLRNMIGKTDLVLEGKTAYEVLRNLTNKYGKQLKAPLDIGKWKVKIKGYEEAESLSVPLYTEELHIYPVFKTAKSQMTAGSQVAIGVVIAGLVVLTGGLAATGVIGYLAQAAFWSGVSLALIGTMQLLFPQPQMDTESQQNSKYLGTPGNTVAVGTRIPIGYGLYKVSGHYISYNINSTALFEIGENSNG